MFTLHEFFERSEPILAGLLGRAEVREMEYTIGDKIERYLAIRAKKKALEDAHDAAIKPYARALEVLENDFRAAMNAQGVQNIKGSNGGLAYKTTIMQCTMEDRKALIENIIEKIVNCIENNETLAMFRFFDLFTNALSKDGVNAFIQEYDISPPGVKITYVTKVNVRK